MTGAGLLAGLAVGVAVEARLLQPRRLVTRETELVLPRWPDRFDGLRVALVADVHVGSPGVPPRALPRLVRAVAAAGPDIILLLGDYLADVRGGAHIDPGEVARGLAPLTAVAPLAAVLGNHDWYAGGYRVGAALRKEGVTVLEDAALPVRVRGHDLWLAGVGDLWERAPDVPAALRDVPESAPVIMLAHNPDCVLDVPPRVSLTVAGHTHAGQIAPLGRPLYSVSPFTRNRFVRGFYETGGSPLYVSPGIGTSLLPIRFGVVPEITILRLRSPGAEELALSGGEC